VQGAGEVFLMKVQSWLGALALGIAALGCDDTVQGMKKDARESGQAAAPVAGEAKSEAKQAGQDLKEGASTAASTAAEKAGDLAKKAGEKLERGVEAVQDPAVQERAKGAARDLAREAAATKQTVDVKAALMADTTVDASKIDVDSDASTHTVTLRGAVPTEAHKTTAGRIAAQRAEGWTVRNELTVGAR
jgi:osmotically-inducible protein OsmY